MIDIKRLAKAWEIFRRSNPYQLCDGIEFRAITNPEYCLGQMIGDTLALLKQYENLEERHATMVDAADKLYAELRSRPEIIYCDECAFFDSQDGKEAHSRCRLRNCDTNGLEFCSRATRKKGGGQR